MTKADETTRQIVSEIAALKQVLRDATVKLSHLESLVQGQLGSHQPREIGDLEAMANDRAIQAEIAAINAEFAVTEMDGLEGL